MSSAPRSTPDTPETPKPLLTEAQRVKFREEVAELRTKLEAPALRQTPDHDLEEIDSALSTIGKNAFMRADDYHDGRGDLKPGNISRLTYVGLAGLRTLEQNMMGGDRSQWTPGARSHINGRYIAARTKLHKQLRKISPALAEKLESVFHLDGNGIFIPDAGREDGDFAPAQLDTFLTEAHTELGGLYRANNVHDEMRRYLEAIAYVPGWAQTDDVLGIRNFPVVTASRSGTLGELRAEAFRCLNRKDVDTPTRRAAIEAFINGLERAANSEKMPDSIPETGSNPDLGPLLPTNWDQAIAMLRWTRGGVDELYNAAREGRDADVQRAIAALNMLTGGNEDMARAILELLEAEPLHNHTVNLRGATLIARKTGSSAPRPLPVPTVPPVPRLDSPSVDVPDFPAPRAPRSPEVRELGRFGKLVRSKIAWVLAGLGAWSGADASVSQTKLHSPASWVGVVDNQKKELRRLSPEELNAKRSEVIGKIKAKQAEKEAKPDQKEKDAVQKEIDELEDQRRKIEEIIREKKANIEHSESAAQGLGTGYSAKRSGNKMTLSVPAGKKHGTDYVIWLAKPKTQSARYIGGVSEADGSCAFDLPASLADGEVSMTLGKVRPDGAFEALTDGSWAKFGK